jgi:hypothetical protein
MEGTSTKARTSPRMEVHNLIMARNIKIEVNLQRMMKVAKERRKTRKVSNVITVRSMVTLQVNAEVKRSQDNITMMNPK